MNATADQIRSTIRNAPAIAARLTRDQLVNVTSWHPFSFREGGHATVDDEFFVSLGLLAKKERQFALTFLGVLVAEAAAKLLTLPQAGAA